MSVSRNRARSEDCALTKWTRSSATAQQDSLGRSATQTSTSAALTRALTAAPATMTSECTSATALQDGAEQTARMSRLRVQVLKMCAHRSQRAFTLVLAYTSATATLVTTRRWSRESWSLPGVRVVPIGLTAMVTTAAIIRPTIVARPGFLFLQSMALTQGWLAVSNVSTPASRTNQSASAMRR